MFESYYSELCEAIGTDHNIGRVADCCVSLISDHTYDITMIAANPAYDRAHALIKELRHNLRASNDQCKYLLKLIALFKKVRDPQIIELADSMESELLPC